MMLGSGAARVGKRYGNCPGSALTCAAAADGLASGFSIQYPAINTAVV
jgi:hypothetical protein